MARRRRTVGRLQREPSTGRFRDRRTGRFLPPRIVQRRERGREQRVREDTLRRLRAREKAREERARREAEKRPPVPKPRFRRGLRTPAIEETRRGVFRIPAGQPGGGQFLPSDEARRRIAISQGVQRAQEERRQATALPILVDEPVRPPEVLLDPFTTFEILSDRSRRLLGLGVVLRDLLRRTGALTRLARIGDRLVDFVARFTVSLRLSPLGQRRGLPAPPTFPPVEVSGRGFPARQVLDAILDLWAADFRGEFEFQMYQVYGRRFAMEDLVLILHHVQVEVTGA